MTPAARLRAAAQIAPRGECCCGCGGQTARRTRDGEFSEYLPGHLVRAQARATREERFWASVDISDIEGCWWWTGARDEGGYARFWAGGKGRSAHRFVYALIWGEITPSDLTVDHLCGARHCVNPNHMELVTRAENSRRARNALTECPNGHPYTPEIRYTRSDGYTGCRMCKRNSAHRRNEKKRELTAERYDPLPPLPKPRAAVSSCQRCFAIVGRENIVKHDAWHDSLEAR